MLALASTSLGNGVSALVYAAITVGVFLALKWMKKLPPDKARLRRVQLLVFVLGIVLILTLTLALESLARIWDPQYVYDGS